MHDKHQRAIITVQDPAMRKAIEKIFSNIIHRCCQWHMMRKVREQLGPLVALKKGLES
jgi:MULE transposase domain